MFQVIFWLSYLLIGMLVAYLTLRSNNEKDVSIGKSWLMIVSWPISVVVYVIVMIVVGPSYILEKLLNKPD